MSDKHHRYYKHTKFRQNLRGDPKFLVDLTWNDPIKCIASIFAVGRTWCRYNVLEVDYNVSV